MNGAEATTCVFIDVGGVLLTDGWSHSARKNAFSHFKLDATDLELRHHLIFDVHQAGKLTLDEYLDNVIFFQRRPFTHAQFRRFMFSQSRPYPEMLELVARLKAQHKLKIVVVSNEGRELNAHRIAKFKLATFVDAFVTSCFVHVLKPDSDIFGLALDIAQVSSRRVVYIDDTAMFVQAAEHLGIRGIHHTGYQATCTNLASFGLQIDAPDHP
jgi:HAD superfamily hydrolase (TIGR01509 family)